MAPLPGHWRGIQRVAELGRLCAIWVPGFMQSLMFRLCSANVECRWDVISVAHGLEAPRGALAFSMPQRKALMRHLWI